MTRPPASGARFSVRYAPDLCVYVVERGEMRIVPSNTPRVDPDGAQRAREVAEALNRIYATLEASSDAHQGA